MLNEFRNYLMSTPDVEISKEDIYESEVIGQYINKLKN